MAASVDPDRGFIRTPSGQIHFRQLGMSTGTAPLICLHASPASSKSLIPLVQRLGAKRHVLAPDTMGNGESDALSVAAPSLEDYARAMDEFCEAQSFDSVDVYGNHTGAHIAIEWAILNPKRVRRVVLDQVAVLTPDLRAEFLQRYAPPKQPDEIGSQFYWAWQFMRDQMLFSPHYEKDASKLHHQGVFEAETLHDLTMDLLRALKTYHLSYEAVFSQDLEARLKLVDRPVLATVTDADTDPFLAEHLKEVEFAPLNSADRLAQLQTHIEAFLDR